MADEDNGFPHEFQTDSQKLKKRRLQGACDACRKKKTKCDSAMQPICTSCKASKLQCTHDEPRQPTKRETQQAYIRSLEERISKMERVFRVLHPDKDIETLLELPLRVVSESRSSVLVSDALTIGSSLKSFPELRYPTPHLTPSLSSDASSPESVKQESVVDPEEEHDLSHVELAEHLNRLFLEDRRFFGQSSSYMFAHYTMHAKLEANGTCTPYPLDSKMLRRPLYWELRPWELSFARSKQNTFVFPEPDLLNSLVALYFEKSNILMPILHKPIFLRSLTSGLHLRDPGFGMAVLLVCAIASRFTSDTRVLLDDDISSLSSGWEYFSQVPAFRNQLFERCTLYDIQCYALSIIYLLGTSVHVAWPLLGLGLRFAQEKGLHRRKGKQEHTVEDELEKRVFWSLICIDRWMSAFLGRPCAMQDEEFDLEYPVECDEEYWETPDPKDAFQQPPGKPSKMTYFICTLKLAELLGFALRTLYATKKSKMLFGLIGNEWESQVVAELDSSMNKWKDSLPHFLRWNPENPDNVFFSQSIALYTCFYHLQIQIHRPFLMKWSALSLTSLAICNNAARSTSHILETSMSRGAALFPSVYMSAFASALVLLLTHWAYQQTESTFDSKTTMELVRKIFLTLKDGERKWHLAGRLCDLTQILGCLSDHRSNPQLKRRRETEEPAMAMSQNQRNLHSSLWEQTSLAGGSLQRQIAAAKLEPPARMQASYGPTSWGDVNNSFASQIAHPQTSHPQPFFNMTSHDNSHPIPNPDTASFVADPNFQPTQSTVQATQLPDPGINFSGELIELWANLPLSFGSNEWDAFFSDVQTQFSQ